MASTPAEAARSLAKAESGVGALLGEDCYGRDGDTLEAVVGRMLLERGLRLAVAESCTGGLLGHRLTSVPGSSAYFERGVLAYSNRAMEELLGVPESLLSAHGSVSGPCAEAMARGVASAGGLVLRARGHRNRGTGRRHAGQARRHRLRRPRGQGQRRSLGASTSPETALP